MQIIQLDISQKGEIPAIEAKQDDVGRKFQVQILESDVPYMIPSNAVISLWYSGTSGEGNYTEIEGESPFLVSGNTVTIELIRQMLQLPGGGMLCLVINDENGGQVGLWNIPYHVEKIPGTGSETAEDYFSALSEMVRAMEPDASLTAAGRPAEAKAVGDALTKLAQEKMIIDYHEVEDDVELDYTLLTIISHLENYSQKQCVLFMTGTGASLPYGVWVFEITRVGTHVQIRGVCGSQTVSRIYKDSMLKNGSFEMVPEIPGWHSNNPAISYPSSEIVRSGAYSMMVRDVSTDGGGQLVSDSVPAVPGTSYTATVYVSGTADSQLWLRFTNTNGEVISQSYRSATPVEGSWQVITVTAQAPASAVQMFLVLATTKSALGTTYFDDAELKITGMTGNLLKNPSFESVVKIPGWTSNAYTNTLLTSERVRYGNGRCAIKLIDNSEAAGMQLISDPVAVTPGETYAVSADFTGDGMCQLWLRFLDNNGTILAQQYKTVIPKQNDWSHFSVSYLAPVKATKACVVLATVKSTTACAFVDNVFLASVDEVGSYEADAERFTVWKWADQANGTMADGGALTDISALSQLVYDTLTDMASPSSAHLAVICDFTYETSSGSLTLHKAIGMDGTYEATAVLVTSKGDILFGTSYDDSLEGQWQPIEWAWSNPPMEEGVEYVTVDRFDGKPVYQKLINFGELPQYTNKSISTGISPEIYDIVGVERIAIEIGTQKFVMCLSSITEEYIYASGDQFLINVTSNSNQSVNLKYLIRYVKQ